MSEREPSGIKGACPGALRPMESGDGLIVRVRPHGGALSLSEVRGLALIAERFGNGAIDLTRRSNVQIRGVSAAGLAAVQAALADLSLLDQNADAEAVRNIIVSPLAGLDPTEAFDARPVAMTLEGLLAADRRLWQLSPKFGFVISGGGMLSLDGADGDLIAKGLRDHRALIGCAGPSGPRWFGAVASDQIAETLVKAAHVYLDLVPPRSRLRLKEADQSFVSAVAARMGLASVGVVETSPMRSPRLGDLGVALGLGVAFGRIEARHLRALADLAERCSAVDVRVSPWRALYIPGAPAMDLDAVVGMGFLVSDDDPLARIDACPGEPQCRSAYRDTRAAARKLASFLPLLGIASAHVSGCPKGCARPGVADLVLVGHEAGFGVIRNGRASDRVTAVIGSIEELAHHG